MAKIILQTFVRSDCQTCFDLARNIDFHKESLMHSNEKAIGGRTSGLIELYECVTWEARHFGITQRLTSKIVAFESPILFIDEMVSGAFKSFRHEHIFEAKNNATLITDNFYFESPLGVLGKFVNWLFLKRYMTNLLKRRNQFLKEKAEMISE